VDVWCAGNSIPVLLRIPFDREVAGGYAQGCNLLDSMPYLRPELTQLLAEVAL
jgi:MinD superfamily P-loop ATPase